MDIEGSGSAASNSATIKALAIRSSNHRDRTERDRKTDRAFHLMRFFGTDEETPAPPAYDWVTPRVRREVVDQQPLLQLSEQEKKLGLANSGQRPGESAEAYEVRKAVMRRQRNQEDEWKWTLEDGKHQNRWDGKEDVTQTANYVVVFPPTDPNGPVKIALLDQWIDMRKYVDNSARKKELQEELLRKNIRLASKRVKQNATRHVAGEDEGGRGRPKKVKVTWVEGRESEAASKKYRSRGVIGSDDEDDETFRNPNTDERGVDVDDIIAEDLIVDHEHGLAIDRMQEDGDEFQDVEYEFDDDDEGEDELVAAEDKDGLADGNIVVQNAAMLDAEEEMDEDEEEEPSRPQSSSSSSEGEEEEEEEETKPSRPSSRVPFLSTKVEATTAPVPPRPIAIPQQVRPKSIEQQIREFITQSVRMNAGQAQLAPLILAIKNHFGAAFDKPLVGRLIKEMLIVKKSQIDGQFFVLRDDEI